VSRADEGCEGLTVLKTAAGTLKMIDIIELRFKHMKTVAIRLAKNLHTVVSIKH
jgi:hypothetical protein